MAKLNDNLIDFLSRVVKFSEYLRGPRHVLFQIRPFRPLLFDPLSQRQPLGELQL